MASSRSVSFSLCAILTDSKFFHNVSHFDMKSVLFQGTSVLIICHQTLTKLHIIGNTKGAALLRHNSGSILGPEILIPHFHDKRCNKSLKWSP